MNIEQRTPKNAWTIGRITAPSIYRGDDMFYAFNTLTGKKMPDRKTYQEALNDVPIGETTNYGDGPYAETWGN